jgi:hypothetical protein
MGRKRKKNVNEKEWYKYRTVLTEYYPVYERPSLDEQLEET